MPKPKKLLAESVPFLPSHYHITFQALDEEENPVPGAHVRVLVQERTSPTTRDLPATNGLGKTECAVNVRDDESLIVHAHILGNSDATCAVFTLEGAPEGQYGSEAICEKCGAGRP